MDIGINDLDAFSEVYGFVAGDDAQRFASVVVNDLLEENGLAGSFLGHPGGANFILIIPASKSVPFKNALKERFAEQIKTQYSFIDRNNGFITTINKDAQPERHPFMSLSIGIIDPQLQPVSDIREITELSTKERRKDQ